MSGVRQPWLELLPPDRAGIGGVFGISITPNAHFYTYERRLSDLYLIEGLK